MEHSRGFPPPSPDRYARNEVIHYLVSRVGTFVLCGVLLILGSCKGSDKEVSKENPHPNPRSQRAADDSAEEADARREERDEERQLFRDD